MADDQGIVVGIYGGNAKIKSRRSEACDHCEAQDGCRVMGGASGKEMFFEVENTLDAKMGDQVKVRVSDKAFLKAIFLVYVIPMIAFMGGAVLGQEFGLARGYDPSASSAIMAFGLMALTFSIVRIVGNRLGQTRKYKPRMIKITARAGNIEPMSCPPE